MRTRLIPIATLAAGLAACTDTAPRALPAGDAIGADLLPRSVQVVGDAPYWIEVVQAASGETAPSLRLRRGDAGATTTLDTLPDYYIEQRGPFVVADGDELIWGLGTSLLGCGHSRWLRVGAPPMPVPFLSDGSACRAAPLELRDGQVLAMTVAETTGPPTTALTRFALATDAREPVGELADLPVEQPRVVGDEAFVLTTTAARIDEGQLVQVPLAAPTAQRPVGATIADRGGLAVTDDRIVVVDNGGAGAPARVLGYPRAADAGDAATVIAALPGPAHDLTAAGGALWMIAGPARPTGGVFAASPTLWRVELDGTLTTFVLDAPALELASTSDALLVVIAADAAPPSLHRVPLPAQ